MANCPVGFLNCIISNCPVGDLNCQLSSSGNPYNPFLGSSNTGSTYGNSCTPVDINCIISSTGNSALGGSDTGSQSSNNDDDNEQSSNNEYEALWDQYAPGIEAAENVLGCVTAGDISCLYSLP